MKTNKIAEKVSKKTAKIKAKAIKKATKVRGKCAALAALFVFVAIMDGCTTSEQPITAPSMQAGKSETMHATLNQSQIYVLLGAKRLVTGATSNAFELAEADADTKTPDITILGQAQALDSRGTETYSPSNSPSNSPTATPSNTVTTDITAKYNDALAAATTASKGVLTQLAGGLDAVLGLMSSKKEGTVAVKKTDGTTALVECKDGQCSFCTDCEAR